MMYAKLTCKYTNLILTSRQKLKSKIERLFFALLRDALWHGEEDLPKELSSETVAVLFSIAEKQTVSGLLVDALTRNNIKMHVDWVLDALGLLEQIKKQSIAVNKGVRDLHLLLSASGVNYIVVKGQAVASYYPNPLLRQSGDIDYYCSKEYFPQSQEVISRAWMVNTDPENNVKHCRFDYNDVVYEGHFQLLELYDKKSRTYWQRLLDRDEGGLVMIDGVAIKTLSPTLHVLYIFLHLYNHLINLGVGLRQFCDMAVMMRYAKGQIDMDALRDHLHALGMEKAYRACCCILVDYLGLSEEELGYVFSGTDHRYGEKILDVVLFRGNMGHYEGKTKRYEKRWKWKMKAVGIKFSHFMKFLPLAPSYTCGWLWHEVRRNI